MNPDRIERDWHAVRHLPFRWHVVDDAATAVRDDLSERRCTVIDGSSTSPLGLECHWRERLRDRLADWLCFPGRLAWPQAIDRVVQELQACTQDRWPAVLVIVGDSPALAIGTAVRAALGSPGVEGLGRPGCGHRAPPDIWLAPRHGGAGEEPWLAGRLVAPTGAAGDVPLPMWQPVWPDAAYLDAAWMGQGCRTEWLARADRALAWAQLAAQMLPTDLQAWHVAQRARREIDRWRGEHAGQGPDPLARAVAAMAIWHAGLAIAHATSSVAPAPAPLTAEPSEPAPCVAASAVSLAAGRPTEPALP